jgi:hypothetical protein
VQFEGHQRIALGTVFVIIPGMLYALWVLSGMMLLLWIVGVAGALPIGGAVHVLLLGAIAAVTATLVARPRVV